MTFADFPLWDNQSDVKNCIYAYVHRETQKAYIGQAADLKRRDYAHQHNKRNKTGIDPLLRAHREDFDVRILAQDLPSQQSLNEYEAMYIRTFDTYHNGYNMTEQRTDNANKIRYRSENQESKSTLKK